MTKITNFNQVIGNVAAINRIKSANGELFLAYVNKILLPTLREGDIVVLDNLSSHKVAGVKEAIASLGRKSCIFRPTVPTSIQLKMSSRN